MKNNLVAQRRPILRTILLCTMLSVAAFAFVYTQAQAQDINTIEGTQPDDSSTSFCDEVTVNVPTFCVERQQRIDQSGGANAFNDPSSPILGPTSILYKTIQAITILTGAISVIMIIIGGFRYVVSGGDSNATKGAKDTILYAVIGLVIAIFAQTIVTFVLSKL